ncbi:MAG: phosphotransferase [Caldilineaceae bacterium]
MTFDSLRFRTLPYRTRIAAHLQSSLLRNGYALVFNSMATSALGVFYWMLAAHIYSAPVVGLNAALINAMLFLAQSAQLNLTNGVNRFLPVAGKRSMRFILSVYAVGLVAAPLVCLIYFLGIEAWATSLYAVFVDWHFALLFVAATMAWCIFALQDSVLIGLRQATWVPVENLTFAVAKLVLLVVLVKLLPNLGIFLSWVVPMALLLLPVNWVIFRYLAPRHIVATDLRSEPLTVGSVTRYVAGDYLGSLVMTATTGLLPLMVLEQAGAATNAYFSIAWTIANSLYLVSRNMGMSLISEASLDRGKLELYRRRVLLQTFKVLVPITLFIVITAPWLLRLFGQAYSSEATTLLRLLALSALPAVIPSLSVSVNRVQRKLMRVFIVQAALCGLVVVLSYLLLKRDGITGIGLAWLIGQSVIALILVLYEALFDAQYFRPLDNSATNYRFISHDPILQLSRPLRSGWSRWGSSYRWLRMRPTISQIVQQVRSQNQDLDWQVQEMLPTLAETAVFALGQSNGQRRGVLKLPLNDGSLRYSHRQQQMLMTLHADAALGSWRNLLPKLLVVHAQGRQPYVVESFLDGQAMEKLLAKGKMQDTVRMQAAALEAILVLHRHTAQLTLVDDRLLASWVWQPIETLKRLYPGRNGQAAQATLDRLAEFLGTHLRGKLLAVGTTHGDFAPCNLLFSEDSATLTGIVDWEQALTEDLPMLDLLFLLLTTRAQLEQRELGNLVEQLLASASWSEPEQSLLTSAQNQLPGEPLPMSILLLLTWLRHVSMTVDKSERYRRNLVWRSRNIDLLLERIDVDGKIQVAELKG